MPSLVFCFSCQAAAAAAVARSKENFTYMSDAVLLRSSWRLLVFIATRS